MANKVQDFVKAMEEKGVSLEVNGNFVKASPPDKMTMQDVLKMQQLNTKGELAKYLTR